MPCSFSVKYSLFPNYNFISGFRKQYLLNIGKVSSTEVINRIKADIVEYVGEPSDSERPAFIRAFTGYLTERIDFLSSVRLTSKAERLLQSSFNLLSIEQADVAIIQLCFTASDDQSANTAVEMNDSFFKLIGLDTDDLGLLLFGSENYPIPPLWWVFSKPNWLQVEKVVLQALFSPSFVSYMDLDIVNYKAEIIPCFALCMTDFIDDPGIPSEKRCNSRTMIALRPRTPTFDPLSGIGGLIRTERFPS